MKILSFDIGSKNLAYCYMDNKKIIEWDILDISGSNSFDNLIDKLHLTFPDAIFDVILIENQPAMKNPIMKSIQMVVFTYFKVQNYQYGSSCDVKFYSASNKLKLKEKINLDHIKTTNKYRKNKLSCIALAYHYIQITNQELKWIELFKSTKKVDDLADSLCQLIHYIENN